jgi:lipid-A-disaccharide synthase-like uncharacterized protein
MLSHLDMTSGIIGFTMESLGAHFRMPFQDNYLLWKIIGFLGMTLFFSRFFVQWLYSEKHKESKIPTIFWWQSLLGSVFMLAYSLRQQDSVYILGYLFTVIPYTRNLILIYRKPRSGKTAAASPPLARKAEDQGFPVAARAVTRA